jgi:hypothetical protein
VVSSQNVVGAGSSKINGGVLHRSTPWASSPIQVIQEHAELEHLQVSDWEDEASKDEAAEEERLARVHQEIERLRQEQEAITRRHVVA